MYGENTPFYGNPTEERDGRTHATAKKAAYCLYRNLHTGGWSLRFKGKVIEHLPADQAVIFNGVVFPRVEQAGKKRAMAEKQRNVHAYLCSHEKPTVVKNADYAREIIERMGFRRVSYSPFSDLGWHYVDHKTSFRIAEGAILLGGREVWVPTRYSGYRENPECPSFVRKRLKRYFYVRDGRINPDWIEDLQAGDVVRIAPHDSAACNYTLTKLDKASDLVEYKDRFDGKPKTSTWSAFLETLKKSWKAELAAFVKAGIERRKERIARAKKRGSKTQIEKAEQELARFKSAYGKEGLKKSAPPPDPEVVPEEEKPKKTKKTKEVSVEEFFEDIPSEVVAVSTKATKPKKTAAKGGKSAAGEVKVTPIEIPAAPDSEGWLKVDHVRVATVMENNAPSGFETYGYEKDGLSYYRNADGAWEVMHQASGLRLHALPSEVDARMFAENVLEVKIPPLDVLTSSEDALSASKKKVRATFLERVNSLKQTQEAVQEVVEKAQASEIVDEDEIEESEEEASEEEASEEEASEEAASEEAEYPHLSMGQDILAWWNENKASIASGDYGGDYRATIHALQQIAGFERKARLGEPSGVDTSHFEHHKRQLRDLYKKELSHLRSLSGLGSSWFGKKSDIVAFARTFIPMLFSGWTENTSIQEAVRDLANLLLPIEEIEPLLNVSDHGNLPAWVYLYHVERIAQELGQPIHYDADTVKSTTKSLGALGGAVQLWKAFASEDSDEKKKPESSVATSEAIAPAHPTKKAQSSPASVETYKPLYTIEKSNEWVPEPDDKDAGEWVDFYTIRNRKGDAVRNRQGELVERKSKDTDAVVFQLRALDDWKQVIGDDWERFTASEFDGKPKKALHITPDLKLRTEAMQRADTFALQEDDDGVELRIYLTGILFHNSYAIATDGHRAAYIPTSYANDGEITTLRMDDFGGSVEQRKILPSHYPTNSLIEMLDTLAKEEKVKKHTAKQIPRTKVVFNTVKAKQTLALMMKTLSAFRLDFLTLGMDHKGSYFAPTYHEDYGDDKLSRRFEFFRVYFSSDALASSDHQAHEIHVNGNYLLQALQSGDKSEVSQISFYHQDPLNKSSGFFGKPICVRRGNGEIHIIMPVRSVPLTEKSYKERFESWLSGYKENPALFKGDKPTPLFYHIGAKNQLWPHIRDILKKIGTDNIAEPFAGSAVVSRNYGAKKIYLAEQNSEIREIFQRLKKGNPETLFRQMLLFEVEDHLQTELDLGDEYKAAKALHQRIFLDPFGRLQFPTDKLLSSRLQVIKEAAKEMRKAIIYADALDMIEDLKDRSDVTWFVDPPYPEACHVGYGERGKCYNMDDYNELLTALSKVRGPVMITGYENMRPPKRMGYKEKGIEVDVKIGKSGKGRKNIEYIWWKA